MHIQYSHMRDVKPSTRADIADVVMHAHWSHMCHVIMAIPAVPFWLGHFPRWAICSGGSLCLALGARCLPTLHKPCFGKIKHQHGQVGPLWRAGPAPGLQSGIMGDQGLLDTVDRLNSCSAA